MMIITFMGCKSEKEISLPVNYINLGSELLTVSFKRRHWWRNLRGGAQVTVWLRGRNLSASSIAIEEDEGVSAQLEAYFKKSPQYAKYLHVNFDARGNPLADDVLRLAKDRVVVLTRLNE